MKLLSISLIIWLMISPLSHAADSEGNYAVWGVGKKSCFNYMQARAKDDYENYSNYIKGFLTAYNMMENDTYSITATKPFSQLLEWLDDQCELKQMNPLEQALLELIDDNFEKRLKSPRQSSGR